MLSSTPTRGNSSGVSPQIVHLVDCLRIAAECDDAVLEVGSLGIYGGNNNRLLLDRTSVNHVVSFLEEPSILQRDTISLLVLRCNVTRSDGAKEVLGQYLRSTPIAELRLVGDMGDTTALDDGSLLECVAEDANLALNHNLSALELQKMNLSVDSTVGSLNRLRVLDLLLHQKQDFQRLTFRMCRFDLNTGPSELLREQKTLEAFCFQDPLILGSSSFLSDDFKGNTDTLLDAVMRALCKFCPDLKELSMHVAAADFSRKPVKSILALLAKPDCKLQALQLSTGRCTQFSSDLVMQKQLAHVLTTQNSSLLEVSLQCSAGNFHEKMPLLPVLERNEFLSDIRSSLGGVATTHDSDEDHNDDNVNTSDDAAPLNTIMSFKLWGQLLITLGNEEPVVGLSPTFLVLKSPETNLIEHISASSTNTTRKRDSPS